MPLLDVFKDYFSGINKPVVYNFESGHSEPMLTLPLGAKARLNTLEKRITILEKVID